MGIICGSVPLICVSTSVVYSFLFLQIYNFFSDNIRFSHYFLQKCTCFCEPVKPAVKNIGTKNKWLHHSSSYVTLGKQTKIIKFVFSHLKMKL